MDVLFSYINLLLLYTIDYFIISISIYFILILFYSAFSLPGLILFIVMGGYLYGIYFGYAISIIGITLGSLIFFLLSKFFFKNFLLRFYKKYTKNIDEYISKSTMEYLIILRLIPGTPLMLQNFILSLLDISILNFLLASLIGFTPIIFLSVFIGNKINDIQSINELSLTDILTWDFLFVIMVIIFLLILRIKIKKNRLNN